MPAATRLPRRWFAGGLRRLNGPLKWYNGSQAEPLDLLCRDSALHPNKYIREALKYAQQHGWNIRKSGPRARLECHLLPVRTQGVLDVDLLDAEESREACTRYPANCRSLSRTIEFLKMRHD